MARTPTHFLAILAASLFTASASGQVERIFKANVQAKDATGLDRRVIQLRDQTHAAVIVFINDKFTPTFKPTIEDPIGNNGRGIWEGSATFVHPCYATTAYHSVFGGMEKPEADALQSGPLELRVTVTAVINHPLGEREVKLIPRAWGKGLYENGQFIGFSKEDITLLEDPDCHGKEMGWFPISMIRPNKAHLVELETLGYPVDALSVIAREQYKYPGRDLTLELVRDYGVRVYELDRTLGLVSHNGSIQPRGSGGALIHRLPNGIPFLVGINLGTLRVRKNEVVPLGDSRAANISIHAADIDPAILSIIRNDKRYSNIRNPVFVAPVRMNDPPHAGEL